MAAGEQEGKQQYVAGDGRKCGKTRFLSFNFFRLEIGWGRMAYREDSSKKSAMRVLGGVRTRVGWLGATEGKSRLQ